MDLLKSSVKNAAKMEQTNLHSNMDLLKFRFSLLLPLDFRIYIPIWIYSNTGPHLHFGVYQEFTFQYGSTQIIYIGVYPQGETDLHSNMDLLK